MARLRGVKYITWEHRDKLVQQDEVFPIFFTAIVTANFQSHANEFNFFFHRESIRSKEEHMPNSPTMLLIKLNLPAWLI